MITDSIIEKLTAKDFESDQEIRWCPGCGDYAILKQVQTILPEINIPKEKIVFISGIGCSSRFPYYLDVYGMHSIHGRAAAIASGLKAARPDLNVWIVSGDGDGLSIGLGHTMHLFRRNFNVNLLLFNNQIYGLTKGQYSPTSEQNKTTKSTPYGSLDHPFNPIKLALGADASFIARSLDRNTSHLRETLLQANTHQGTSFLEIYQNCNIFNDGAFDVFIDKNQKNLQSIYLQQGQPLVFGNTKNKGIVLDAYKPRVVDLEKDAISINDLWVHDEQDIFKAHILSEFFNTEDFPRPFGVLYKKERPCYEQDLQDQMNAVTTKKGKGNLQQLITGKETWQIT